MTSDGLIAHLSPSHRVVVERQWTVMSALVAGLVAAADLVAPVTTALYDAGITASAGTFILHGRLPYRDFWLLYGPLAGYLAAALTAVFGNELVVLRLAGLALVMTTAAVAYRLVSSLAPGFRGFSVSVLAAVVPVAHTGLELSPWMLAMFLSLLAIVVAQSGKRREQVLAGVLVGLAALARLDLGAYALAAVVVSSRSLRPVIGAVAVALPVAVVFLTLVPAPSLVEQLLWYPLVGPRVYREFPAPAPFALFAAGETLSWLLYWIPIGLIVLTVARRWPSGRPASSAHLALLVLAVLCRLQTLGRADDIHAAQAMTPAILLAACLLAGPVRGMRRVALAGASSVMIALAALPLVWFVAPADPYERALVAAIGLIQSQTSSQEPIFVGESRNRHMLSNPLLAYYLADRPPGVRDTMYNPGVTTTDSTQRRMVDDLRANGVRYLILDVRFAHCYETSNDSRLRGSTILDGAIAQDYTVVADMGALVVMARRDVSSDIVAPIVWADPAPPPSDGILVCDRSDEQP